MNVSQKLYDAIVAGKASEAEASVREAIRDGDDPLALIAETMIPAMDEVGKLFQEEEYFVPELLLCSDAMYAGLSVLRPQIKSKGTEKRRKVVIGVIEGDTHDIGKNLVRIMLEASRFEVFDLGRDIPPVKFVEKAKEVNADLIAISTLMSTTMKDLGKVLRLLEGEGIRDRFRVIVGGGPISQGFADRIGADGYAANAAGAAKVAERLLRDAD